MNDYVERKDLEDGQLPVSLGKGNEQEDDWSRGVIELNEPKEVKVSQVIIVDVNFSLIKFLGE